MPDPASTTVSQQHWVCPDDVRIVGEIHGGDGCPTVILLHGGGQSRRSWTRTARNLAAGGFRVITYDIRGHGESAWSPNSCYDEADLVLDLEAVCADPKNRNPVLIGASIGGATALAAIGLGKVNARGLVLVDIAARTERAGYDRIRAFMLKGQSGFESIEAAAAAVADYRGTPRPENVSGLNRALRRGDDGRYRWHWDPAFLEARHRDIDAREDRLNRYARALTCPTLLIRGGSSDVVSEAGARHFLSLCPTAKFIDIANVGHMLVGDQNDTLGAAALPFLRGIAKA